MGLALTLVAALIMAVMALVRPRIAVFTLMALFIFFKELGVGFASSSGSFVFNQYFVNFLNFKFIEFVIPATWLALVLRGGASRPPYLLFERRLMILLLLWVVVLIFVEHFLHGYINVGYFRLLLSGFMLLHCFSMIIKTEEELNAFIKVFLVMIAAAALIGLIKYVLGYGVLGLRGTVPFYFDSKQINAFAFGAVLMLAYVVNYPDLSPGGRILPKVLAYIMFAILAVTVILCFRRTLWVIMIFSSLAVLLMSRRVKVPQFVAIMFSLLIMVIALLAAPQMADTRSRLATYVGSMNLFDAGVVESQENKVHLENVQQYTLMIRENPGIMLFGVFGYPGEDYLRLATVYSGENQARLGTPHNAILKSIVTFGLPGLLIYMAMFVALFYKSRAVGRLPVNKLSRLTAQTSLIFLFFQFSSSLFFVPPFYTHAKGLMYTFLMVLFVRSSLGLDSDSVRRRNADAGGHPGQRLPKSIIGIDKQTGLKL